MARVVALVGGQKWMEGQMEEAVQGDTANVDGGNARGGKDYRLLLGVIGYMPEKSGFTRPRLSCKEKRATGILDYLGGLLPLSVDGIELHLEIYVLVGGLFLLLLFCSFLFLWLSSL